MQGTLVAMDINKRRLNLLRTADVSARQANGDQQQQQQQQQQQTYAADAAGQAGDDQQLPPQSQPQPPPQQQQPKQQQFDRVLVDAPCSGLGVLAKRWVGRLRVIYVTLMLYVLRHQLNSMYQLSS